MSALDAEHQLLCQQLMAKILAGSGLTMRDNYLEETPSTSTAPPDDAPSETSTDMRCE